MRSWQKSCRPTPIQVPTPSNTSTSWSADGRSAATFPGVSCDSNADRLAGQTIPYRELLAGTGDKVAASTTGAFTRLLRNLLRDPQVGRRIVPIIPDEARTFGIDGLFRQVKIYAPGGQLYEPVDAGLLLSYQEAADGQILEEGITEAGSMASFIAAATSYATWGEPMLPFFVYYSMFGFHRFGDLLWAAGDMRARGFLLAATAGRTTLQGEGLQHCDGHSLLFASAIPNLRAYDPAFAYEMAVIVRDGLERMHGSQPEDLLYYLTLYNEALRAAADAARASRRASSRASTATGKRRRRVLPSTHPGERHRHAGRAWRPSRSSAIATTSAQRSGARPATRRFATMRCAAERWNRLHPGEQPRVPYVQRVLGHGDGPVVAVTDHLKLVPDQIGRFMPEPFVPLGTDGFGLSDTRDRASPPLRGRCTSHRDRRPVGFVRGGSDQGGDSARRGTFLRHRLRST